MKKYYCKKCGDTITEQSKSGFCRKYCRLGKSKFNISKKDLYRLYIKEKKTTRAIAKIYCCSTIIIHRNLKEYNITVRIPAEYLRKEKILVHCTICYKEIKVYPYRLKETQHFYCCKQCKSLGHGIYGNIPLGAQNKSFKHGAYSKTNINHCECGKTISPLAIYCRDCLFKHCIGPASPAWKGGPKSRYDNCPDCGKQKMKAATRCASCAKQGTRNPSYLHGNGYGHYSSEFNKPLKQKIRTRDKYTCQCCGITEI